MKVLFLITTLLTVLLLSLTHTGRADDPRWDAPPDPYGNVKPSMGVVIVALVAALFFMFLLYICLRHCCMDTSASVGGGPLRAIAARSRRAPRGLDRSVIDSFPTFDYSSVKELKIGKGALECAVCLNEFQNNDTLRILPKCDHVFHPECIDTWLGSHTTCPVCRSNLVPGAAETGLGALGNSPNAPPVSASQNDDGVVVSGADEDEISGSQSEENEEQVGESMEQPLNRNRTMRGEVSNGGSRWLRRMRFARSFSTGHVAVKQWENMDRFTLRLPGEVREQLMRGKLVRSRSLVVLPRENSSTTRTGFEGSSRTNWFNTIRFGSVRSDPDGNSTHWAFSLVPPFFSRAPSVRSPKPPAGSSRQGSFRGSVRTEMTRLPV